MLWKDLEETSYPYGNPTLWEMSPAEWGKLCPMKGLGRRDVAAMTQMLEEDPEAGSELLECFDFNESSLDYHTPKIFTVDTRSPTGLEKYRRLLCCLKPAGDQPMFAPMIAMAEMVIAGKLQTDAPSGSAFVGRWADPLVLRDVEDRSMTANVAQTLSSIVSQRLNRGSVTIFLTSNVEVPAKLFPQLLNADFANTSFVFGDEEEGGDDE